MIFNFLDIVNVSYEIFKKIQTWEENSREIKRVVESKLRKLDLKLYLCIVKQD